VDKLFAHCRSLSGQRWGDFQIGRRQFQASSNPLKPRLLLGSKPKKTSGNA